MGLSTSEHLTKVHLVSYSDPTMSSAPLQLAMAARLQSADVFLEHVSALRKELGTCSASSADQLLLQLAEHGAGVALAVHTFLVYGQTHVADDLIVAIVEQQLTVPLCSELLRLLHRILSSLRQGSNSSTCTDDLRNSTGRSNSSSTTNTTATTTNRSSDDSMTTHRRSACMVACALINAASLCTVWLLKYAKLSATASVGATARAATPSAALISFLDAGPCAVMASALQLVLEDTVLALQVLDSPLINWTIGLLVVVCSVPALSATLDDQLTVAPLILLMCSILMRNMPDSFESIQELASMFSESADTADRLAVLAGARPETMTLGARLALDLAFPRMLLATLCRPADSSAPQAWLSVVYQALLTWVQPLSDAKASAALAVLKLTEGHVVSIARNLIHPHLRSDCSFRLLGLLFSLLSPLAVQQRAFTPIADIVRGAVYTYSYDADPKGAVPHLGALIDLMLLLVLEPSDAPHSSGALLHWPRMPCPAGLHGWRPRVAGSPAAHDAELSGLCARAA